MVYVHYYELPLTNYSLLIYCSLFITRVTKPEPLTIGEVREAELQIVIRRIVVIPGKSVDAISSEP